MALMNAMDRYIAAASLRGALLVIGVLGTIFGFVELVDQLEDVGEGGYRLVDAVGYVLLMMPDRLLEVAPIVALVGSTIALGGLASGNELLAFRVAGVSVWRVAGSVAKVGVLFMLATVLLLQWIAPPLEQRARALRSGGLAAGEAELSAQGFWSREGRRFINVRSVLYGQLPADIDIYEFAPDGSLTAFTHADWADIRDREHWVLGDVVRKSPQGRTIQTERLATLPWASFLSRDQLGLLVVPPDGLAPTDLYAYVRDLRQRDQDVTRYDFILWKRLVLPLSVLAMVLLSVPFAIGPTRSVTMSRRVMLGAAVGIALHFVAQISNHLGVLLALNAPLTSLVLPVMLTAVALFMLNRAR